MNINGELLLLYFRKGLLYSNLFLTVSIYWCHCAWWTPFQDSTFYASIFLVSGKLEGEKEHRETTPSLHYYFLSFFKVAYTAMFHSSQGFTQPRETRSAVKEPDCPDAHPAGQFLLIRILISDSRNSAWKMKIARCSVLFCSAGTFIEDR